MCPILLSARLWLRHIKQHTKLPLDVHLMIENPEKFIDSFVQAGSDMITLHIETISAARFMPIARRLKSMGIKVGVSLNPGTKLEKINCVLDVVDFVLVMSVNPGFGGQEFISGVLPKIRKLRSIFDGDISVDGGINEKNAKSVLARAQIYWLAVHIYSSQKIIRRP